MWGLRWSAGGKFLAQLITWGITVVVIRLLEPADLGLMEMAGVFISFMILFSELGLGAAVIQRPLLEEKDLPYVFGMLLLISGILACLICLVAPLIAVFFSEPRLTLLVQALSIQFLLIGFTVLPQSLLSREMEFKKIATIDFIAAVSGSVTTLVLVLAGLGVWSLVWGSLALRCVNLVGMNYVRPCRFKPSFNLRGMHEFAAFGGLVTLFRILWYFYNKADALIIGKLLGKELLGFYAVGLQIAQLPMEKVTGIINQVALPAFSSVQDDSAQAARHFLKAVRVMSFFAFPILWGLSSVAPELIQIILGAKWAAAALPLQLIALIIPLRMVSNVAIPVAFGLGRPKINFVNALIASVILPAAFLIGSRWGLVGVSLAWVIAYPLIFLVNLVPVVKILDLRVADVLAAMRTPALIGLVMYGGVLGVKQVSLPDISLLLRLAVQVTVGALIYTGFTLLMHRSGVREVKKPARG